MDKNVRGSPTPLEWALITLGISIAIIAVINGVGHKVSTQLAPPAAQQESK